MPFDNWDTEKICELLNNTEEFYLEAREIEEPDGLKTYVQGLYESGLRDAVLIWTKEHVPNLGTVNWAEVLIDVTAD